MINTTLILNIIIITFLSLCGIYDFKTRRIPNYLTFPFIIIALLYNIMTGNTKLALIGLAVSFLIGNIFFILNGVGGGDVKLMMGIATLLGLRSFIDILFISSFIGVIWGIAIMIQNYLKIININSRDILYQIYMFKDSFKEQLLIKDKSKKVLIPFGTCLMIGTFIVQYMNL